MSPTRGTLDAAGSVGCCKAPTKTLCLRPPCPCNMDAWTEQEKRDLAAKRRKNGPSDG